MKRMSRRAFVQGVSAGGLAVGGGLTTMLGASAARAADTSGYKALVCVFFKGGLDCHDVMLPYDQASYDAYADVRRNLLNGYNGIDGGSTRARNRLLPLQGRNGSSFGSRQFALTEEMAPLHDLFENEQASIVANIGPLLEPMNRSQFRDRSRERPPRLFSHNDQQSTWMALSPEGERYGWGGRFADAALLSNANANPVFTSISVSGNEVFLAGETAAQYQVGGNGAQTIREMTNRGLLGSGRNSDTARSLIDAHFGAESLSPTNLFEQDLATINNRAVTANADFNESLDTLAPFTTQFPDNGLGGRLKTIAETIAIRGTLNVSRQVFYASIGGFDTHSNQANSMPNLQRQISSAVAAFNSAMQELGVSNDVTLFTASDFGRTLVVNGDGTDHGWGGHHFVVGGAVNGGNIFGSPPPYTVDHESDSGRGRLIPRLAIEQLAYPLGSWFGLTDAELQAALPRLNMFETPPPIV
ncbi:MAG: DUF1501 domain-containing protein [Pseudomonadota bacterium]